jgi:thioredoxin 1
MAGSYTLTFTDSDFDTEVLRSEQPVLVDFWAVWCGPCRQMAPIIDSLAEKYAGKVKIGKLDVDHNPGAAQRFNVRGIPTMLLFKAGHPVEQIVGSVPEARLADTLDHHVA